MWMTIYSNQAEGSIKAYRCHGFRDSTTIFWSLQTTFGVTEILQNHAPSGKSGDRSLATVHSCSSTDWVSLRQLRTHPVNSRDGHLPKDFKLTMWGYSSLIRNLIATDFSYCSMRTAVKELIAQARNFQKMISWVGFLKFSDPCCIHIKRGCVYTAGAKPGHSWAKLWHFGKSLWVRLCTCTWHQALKMTTKVSQSGVNTNCVYVCYSTQSRMKCYVMDKSIDKYLWTNNWSLVFDRSICKCCFFQPSDVLYAAAPAINCFHSLLT